MSGELIMLIVILIIFFGLLFHFNAVNLDLQSKNKSLEESLTIDSDTIRQNEVIIQEKEQTIEKLTIRNDFLSKYEAIIDVEQKIAELREHANDEIAKLNSATNFENAKLRSDTREEINNLLSDAHNEVNRLLSKARLELEDATNASINTRRNAEAKATELQLKAEEVLIKATNQSDEIIIAAHKKAEEIAGDAYKAMNNAAEYEKIALAMKNIIEGYGDQYIVPTFSLLDDLAEEFGHTEAGEKLKIARDNTRFMIKTMTAAKCDYVERHRRGTAIEFVLDAFNGKVDSILSRVKKDNYGILKQMILDAYELVNNNGTAFRNAVITPHYLDARLEELKWAIVAQELKWEEQEEQRRIKEQLREEERARREYEKAIKEAQKNEEVLRKLIEKAHAEVEQANEEQKLKYEKKLEDLEIKLREAEEKNQRALSMAQQTRAGNVYIISNIGSFGEDIYKIGLTRRLEPFERVKELGDASVPFEFDVHAMIFSDDAPTLEKNLHKKFLRMQLNKVNPRKEFFKVSLNEIREEIEKLNLNVKWTMIAAAKQYKESKAIERAIQADVSKRREWEESQNLVLQNEHAEEEVMN